MIPRPPFRFSGLTHSISRFSALLFLVGCIVDRPGNTGTVDMASARQVWPMVAGTSWIYEGTGKWATTDGGVRSKNFRWTNQVEWAASNPRRHVAVVRGSVHLLG